MINETVLNNVYFKSYCTWSSNDMVMNILGEHWNKRNDACFSDQKQLLRLRLYSKIFPLDTVLTLLPERQLFFRFLISPKNCNSKKLTEKKRIYMLQQWHILTDCYFQESPWSQRAKVSSFSILRFSDRSKQYWNSCHILGKKQITSV